MKHSKVKILSLSLLLISLGSIQAEEPIDYSIETIGLTSSGDFAPYYISSLENGKFSYRNSALVDAKAERKLDLNTRFSYSYGAEIYGAYFSPIRYQHFNGQWGEQKAMPGAMRINQLYGEVKYRGVFLQVGAKAHKSALLNQDLTSGDFVESGNAVPIPEARAGFVDFQNVPFTKGWVQLQGEIGFGKLMDNDWIEDQFNHYNGHFGRGEWYNYKRVYFRFGQPSKRWSITAGMQAAAMFGGKTRVYEKGTLVRTENHNVSAGDFFKIWLPMAGGDDYYQGNHLGSWDFRADVTLNSGAKLSAYFQWPWEDGSGIGKLNGWDGIWGLEYKAAQPDIISGAVVEYLDFTNQSGPLHYSPGDYKGSTVPGKATGADNYYNNNMYNAYAYYGMSIGTPALMSPLYNLDGYPQYVANRMRGFHVGIEGQVTSQVSYRLKGGYRRGWGNGRMTLPEPISLTAIMLEGKWQLPYVKGLMIKGRFEVDRGKMPCNNVGAMLTIGYHGNLSL